MATLNLDTMQKLYDFGGLLAHRVVYFDTVSFKEKQLQMTFNEDIAKELVEHYKSLGFPVTYYSHIVKFDGAFSQ